MANTSVEYNGENIAIWNLSDDEDIDFDRLTASMVHEMFHAFQGLSGENRWPDEKIALFDYNYSAENISMKLREADIIRDILINNNKDALQQLLALRKQRSERFVFEYDYEARIEQIEGCANYVELMTLSQLDGNKADGQWKKILEMITDPARYIPIRVVCYGIGACMLRCLKEFTDTDIYGFDDVPFPVKAIEGIKPLDETIAADPSVEKIIKEQSDKKEKVIETAVTKNEILLEGEYPLYSLNVWDASWNGKYAISNSFVMYKDEKDEMKAIYGDFVVEMGRDCIIRKVYKQ